MIYTLIDTAMSSCVPSEQNELVVRTGLDLRLRRLDTTKMKKDSYVFVVDGSERFNENMCHVMNTTTKALYDSGIPSDCIHLNMPHIRLYNSILDIPKEDRSKGIIICFSESSYNGRQCLYHLFGEKLALKPYQAFVDAMEKVHKGGDAIVFGEEEIMWFPGPKTELKPHKTPEFPEDEVHTSYGKRYQLSSNCVDRVVPVAALCGSLKKWVLDTNPKLRYVNMGPIMGVPKGMQWQMWGWEDIPDGCHPNTATWRQTIVSLKGKKTAEPDTKAQLAEIASTLKTLTEAFGKLAEKLS